MIYGLKPTQKGRLLALYSVMMSCRKALTEFRFASSTLRNFVPSGAAHEAAAGHALAEPSDNYTAAFSNVFLVDFRWNLLKIWEYTTLWLTRRLFAWWDLDLNNNTYLCPQEKNLPS